MSGFVNFLNTPGANGLTPRQIVTRAAVNGLTDPTGSVNAQNNSASGSPTQSILSGANTSVPWGNNYVQAARDTLADKLSNVPSSYQNNLNQLQGQQSSLANANPISNGVGQLIGNSWNGPNSPIQQMSSPSQLSAPEQSLPPYNGPGNQNSFVNGLRTLSGLITPNSPETPYPGNSITGLQGAEPIAQYTNMNMGSPQQDAPPATLADLWQSFSSSDGQATGGDSGNSSPFDGSSGAPMQAPTPNSAVLTTEQGMGGDGDAGFDDGSDVGETGAGGEMGGDDAPGEAGMGDGGGSE